MDDLVFGCEWPPSEVMNMDVGEVFYWHGRAVARRESEKANQDK